MAQICVYLGSRQGEDPRFLEDTRAFGRRLAERGHGLVYGGASVGLMGALADATLGAGGRAIKAAGGKNDDQTLTFFW